MEMRAHMGRLAAVAILPLLAVTAACGGSSSDEAEKTDSKVESASPGSDGSQSDAAVPSLSEEQLKEALLGADAVVGFKGTEPDQKPVTPKADKSECQPLADLTAFGADRSPQAKAFASRAFVASKPGEEGAFVTLGLLSYEKEGATETIVGIRSALAACGEGFKTFDNNQGQTITYTKAEERKVATGGDQSIALKLVAKSQGFQIPMDFVVVSSRSTLAQFTSMNVKNPKGAEVPDSIVSAQLDKLAKVTSG
ncbi:hypothetical protein ABZY19_38930 [Streptomyces sp. NPDC006475]|uniref:hypothetical protein n=1 Tax=Streptomyces sp. NPDC006475 TaxID=3155719 RepID=UPI0033A01A2C